MWSGSSKACLRALPDSQHDQVDDLLLPVEHEVVQPQQRRGAHVDRRTRPLLLGAARPPERLVDVRRRSDCGMCASGWSSERRAHLDGPAGGGDHPARSGPRRSCGRGRTTRWGRARGRGDPRRPARRRGAGRSCTESMSRHPSCYPRVTAWSPVEPVETTSPPAEPVETPTSPVEPVETPRRAIGHAVSEADPTSTDVTDLVAGPATSTVTLWLPHVYILECRDGSYYVGSTWDLERRVGEHNLGFGAAYTRRRPPVRLVWSARWTGSTRPTGWRNRSRGGVGRSARP